MEAELRGLLAGALLALADDEFILGHRDSQWCGYAPILEEDIAFANIALDELGHAVLGYELVAGLRGEDAASYPDALVYLRPPQDFRNIQLVELPNGDWAFSMLRQYLFDSAEAVRLEALRESAYRPLADAAARIRNEEIYHLRHTRAWIERLSGGGEVSRRRVQAALDEIWPYATQLLSPLPEEETLAARGLLPDSHPLRAVWLSQMGDFLEGGGLVIPQEVPRPVDRSEHSVHLPALLDELQSVRRLDPEAVW